MLLCGGRYGICSERKNHLVKIHFIIIILRNSIFRSQVLKRRFPMNQIPPACSTLRVWHPILGLQEQAVDVTPNPKIGNRFRVSGMKNRDSAQPIAVVVERGACQKLGCGVQPCRQSRLIGRALSVETGHKTSELCRGRHTTIPQLTRSAVSHSHDQSWISDCLYGNPAL
jgi:hypothetical protein